MWGYVNGTVIRFVNERGGYGLLFRSEDNSVQKEWDFID